MAAEVSGRHGQRSARRREPGGGGGGDKGGDEATDAVVLSPLARSLCNVQHVHEEREPRPAREHAQADGAVQVAEAGQPA